MVNTSGKGILLWLAHIVRYLNPSTVITDVPIQVQIRRFVKSMRQRSRCWSAEIVVDIGITRDDIISSLFESVDNEPYTVITRSSFPCCAMV